MSLTPGTGHARAAPGGAPAAIAAPGRGTRGQPLATVRGREMRPCSRGPREQGRAIARDQRAGTRYKDGMHAMTAEQEIAVWEVPEGVTEQETRKWKPLYPYTFEQAASFVKHAAESIRQGEYADGRELFPNRRATILKEISTGAFECGMNILIERNLVRQVGESYYAADEMAPNCLRVAPGPQKPETRLFPEL